jgi:hypothetical protein
MTDPVKPSREDVANESCQKLCGRQGHSPRAIVRAEVPILKGHLIITKSHESVVGDGDSMCVPTQVFEDGSWPSKGRLGIYAPFLARSFIKPLTGIRTVEGDATVTCCSFKSRQELAAEDFGEDSYGQEVPRPTGNPTSPIRRQPPAGNEHVNVGMIEESPGPRMENRHKADPGAQPRWITSDFHQSAGGSREKNVVGCGLAHEEEGVQHVGNGEHDVKVGDRQNVLDMPQDPVPLCSALAFWTVTVAAGVVGDEFKPAGVADLEVTTEGIRTAGGDCRQGRSLS